MKEAASWIAQYEKFWTEKLDSLARYLYQQEELQTWKKPASWTSPRSRSRGSTPRRPKGSGGVDRRESAERVVGTGAGGGGVGRGARRARRRALSHLLRRRGRQRPRVRRHLPGGGEAEQARLHLDWPRTTPERESLVTILFKARGRGTELVFRHERFFDEKARDDHKRGWTGLLEGLERYLATNQGVRQFRIFSGAAVDLRRARSTIRVWSNHG
jgi:hypothetical protein